MYNETYDEYIRSILGYPMNNAYDNRNQSYSNQNQSFMNTELEKCYPEIYTIVYPMIKMKCDNFSGNMTDEELENMTDEIYYALETDSPRTTEKRSDAKSSEKTVEKRETRQTNRNLRDLIKILLIREFLNRHRRPGRPPMPPRPPMPGPGPRPPVRPPFEPRYDIFEY